MKKLLCLPTQLYDAPSIKVGKVLFATLSVDIGGIKTRKWNYERVIIFQLVILQNARSVNNTKYICARIQFWIDFCNRGAFDKLAKYTFNAATVFLGKSHGIQIEEQCQCIFSNITQGRKLLKAVRFICEQETGGGGSTRAIWKMIELELLMKPSLRSWRENIRAKNFLLLCIRDVLRNTYFYSCRNHEIRSQIGSTKTFREFWPWRYGLRSFTGVDFKIWGGQKKATY